MNIAYLGPKGTYTERALELFRPDASKTPLASIPAVFQALLARQYDFGFVPIENIVEGPVTQTLDGLLRANPHIRITDATILPIQHAIGTLPNNETVRRIYSKETALAQCSEYLHQKYPNAELIPTDSTSEAMRMIAQKQLLDAAAIGMESSFQLYGLEVHDTNIGNRKNNKTRFVLLGPETTPKTGNDVTSIAVYPRRDRVGLLENLVSVISKEHQINMCSIHSRPDGKGLFVFHIDLQGHYDDLKGCLGTLQERMQETDISVLGSYPYTPFNEQLIKTIGIIGGTGQMGKWFVPFYEALGYKVLVAGRSTRELTYEECVQKSDAVIINVPIEHTPYVIKRIAPQMRKGQLLVDNTGVKTDVVRAMLDETPNDVEVLSVHTMFGPKIKTLFGENVIVIHTEKSGQMAEEFEDILHKYGANITTTTPELHDLHVSLTQGLEHACSTARQATILQSVGHPGALEPFSTPNSRLSHIVDGRVHGGDPQLYATMLKENPYAVQTLTTFIQQVTAIRDAIAQKQTKPFEDRMRENKRVLGQDFLDAKTAESNTAQAALKKTKP